jgi:hypothetical protein
MKFSVTSFQLARISYSSEESGRSSAAVHEERGLSREVHEHDVAPDRSPHRKQAEAFALLRGRQLGTPIAVEMRCRDEPPVEPIAPRMVWTDDASRRPSAAPHAGQRCSAVTAQVVEDADLALVIAHDEQGVAGDPHGEEVSVLGHVLSARHADPAVTEESLDLGREDVGIPISDTRQRAALVVAVANLFDRVKSRHVLRPARLL